MVSEGRITRSFFYGRDNELFRYSSGNSSPGKERLSRYPKRTEKTILSIQVTLQEMQKSNQKVKGNKIVVLWCLV